MKFRVTFKTPDAVDYAMQNALRYDNSLDDEAAVELIHAMEDVAEKFVQWGECITIEFDTETQTATVVPVGK